MLASLYILLLIRRRTGHSRSLLDRKSGGDEGPYLETLLTILIYIYLSTIGEQTLKLGGW